MDNPTVDTIDLYTMPTEKARKLSKRNKCPQMLNPPFVIDVPCIFIAIPYIPLLCPMFDCQGRFQLNLPLPLLVPTALFYGGLFLLPWLWFANIWLFWPEFRHGPDPEVKKYTRWSAIAFSVMTVLFLPWPLVYFIGGPELLGDTWYKLDATQIPLSSYGL